MTKAGCPARDYLAIARHRPGDGGPLRHWVTRRRPSGLMRSYLQTMGFDDARQIAAGVLTQPEEGREPRPRFRGRLIFPIFDSGDTRSVSAGG